MICHKGTFSMARKRKGAVPAVCCAVLAHLKDRAIHRDLDELQKCSIGIS